MVKNPLGSKKDNYVTFEYKLALLFPFKRKRPELIWMEVKVEKDNSKGSQVGGLLQLPSSPLYEFVRPLRDELGSDPEFNPRRLGLEQWESFSRDGRQFSRVFPYQLKNDSTRKGQECLKTLNRGYSCTANSEDEKPPEHNGNQVVMRYEPDTQYARKPEDGWISQYYDVTLADLRIAFDHFTRNNDTFEGNKANDYYVRRSADWVKVVKVSSRYEVEIEGKSLYQEMEVTSDHDVFSTSDGCSIAKHMGFPLRLMRREAAPWQPEQLKEHKIKRHWLSKEHYALLVNTSSQSWDWGTVDLEKWETGIDSPFMVAREDKRHLTPPQFEALVNYIEKHLMARINYFRSKAPGPIKATQTGPTPQHPNAYDRYMIFRHIRPCRGAKVDHFKEFFEQLKQEKMAAGDVSWTDATPPQASKERNSRRK